MFGAIQSAAPALGVEVSPVNVRDASEIERALGAFARPGHGGLIVKGAAARAGDHGRRVFGNRAIANVALQSQFGQARFHGAFSGSAWPWWRGGVALGWFGPLVWAYAYYALFDYICGPRNLWSAVSGK